MKVIEEKLPRRCEICHQKDCFDASANYCFRCSDLKMVKLDDKAEETKEEVYLDYQWSRFDWRTILGCIVGGMIVVPLAAMCRYGLDIVITHGIYYFCFVGAVVGLASGIFLDHKNSLRTSYKPVANIKFITRLGLNTGFYTGLVLLFLFGVIPEIDRMTQDPFSLFVQLGLTSLIGAVLGFIFGGLNLSLRLFINWCYKEFVGQ